MSPLVPQVFVHLVSCFSNGTSFTNKSTQKGIIASGRRYAHSYLASRQCSKLTIETLEQGVKKIQS